MKVNLKVWRQKNGDSQGKMVDYVVDEVSPDMSFLEMIDVLNGQLIVADDEPVAFDHDCREGICGMCSMVIDGRPHGPLEGTTTCQLYMRNYKDGDTINIEPFRSESFPIIKDLAVNRDAFDRIIAAGGYIGVSTGQAQDANNIPVGKELSDKVMDAAACIGCGACVAACPNGSAMLFTSAKVAHLNQLPQGKVEATRRVLNMVKQMDAEGFGRCSNIGACEAECPKEISIANIARLNKDYIKAVFTGE